MPTTTQSDFTIYDDLVHSTRTEVVRQNVQVFNAASGNAIQLLDERVIGQFGKQSFFTEALNVNRRDPNSSSTVSATKFGDDEIVSVKLNRRFGPMSYTPSAFRAKGIGPAEASRILGTQLGNKQAQDWLDSAATGIVAAIKQVGSSDLVKDGTGGSLTFKKLSQGQALFGDARQQLVTALIHGDKLQDLIEDGLDNYEVTVQDVGGQGGANILTGGQLAAMGLRLVVSDEDALITTGSPDTYHTVILQPQGLQVLQSEEMDMAETTQTGTSGTGENIEREWQVDSAYNLRIAGMKWSATGTPNPTDSQLGTSANWAQAASDNKSVAGVIVDSD